MIDKLGFEYSKTLRTDHGRGKGYFFRSETDQDPDSQPSASQAAAHEAARIGSLGWSARTASVQPCARSRRYGARLWGCNRASRSQDFVG